MAIGDHAAFEKVRRAAAQYSRNLRKLAKHIRDMVDAFDFTDPAQMRALMEALASYADIIEPWAAAVAKRMIADVSNRDVKAWEKYTRTFGKLIRHEARHTAPGIEMQEVLNRQVELITSLPTKAAERVHEMTIEGLSSGRRADDIRAEIQRDNASITRNRAQLIARTEVARTASTFTMVRAQAVGSSGYIWRTSRDSRVRASHADMEGKYVAWNDPPRLSDGTTTHAGMIYNCRCYAEPVLPNE